MSISPEHQDYMRQALALARRAEGFTSPNPLVGAVVVAADAGSHGRIVGTGYHRQAGAPHAEVEALRQAAELAHGATMYVTLEPCNHHGRTPPCTEAIVQAGITTLYYAAADPNPAADGGHEALAQAGIAVHSGLCMAEAHYLNRFFFHHTGTGSPYVLAKFAATLDGKIATHTGHSHWITGADARHKGHLLRQAADAILVGVGTTLADNPRLTTRLPGAPVSHPLRVVLDSQGRTPLTAALFDPSLPGQTVVATTAAMPAGHRAALARQGVTVWEMCADKDGRVHLPALLNRLGEQGILSLLIEGGSTVLGAFFDAGLVNELWAFIAPLIIGGQTAPGAVGGSGAAALPDAWRLQDAIVEKVGQDLLVHGRVLRGANK